MHHTGNTLCFCDMTMTIFLTVSATRHTGRDCVRQPPPCNPASCCWCVFWGVFRHNMRHSWVLAEIHSAWCKERQNKAGLADSKQERNRLNGTKKGQKKEVKQERKQLTWCKQERKKLAWCKAKKRKKLAWWQVCKGKECQLKLTQSCVKQLACGHWCGGVAGELSCLPCLHVSHTYFFPDP